MKKVENYAEYENIKVNTFNKVNITKSTKNKLPVYVKILDFTIIFLKTKQYIIQGPNVEIIKLS